MQQITRVRNWFAQQQQPTNGYLRHGFSLCCCCIFVPKTGYKCGSWITCQQSNLLTNLPRVKSTCLQVSILNGQRTDSKVKSTTFQLAEGENQKTGVAIMLRELKRYFRQGRSCRNVKFHMTLMIMTSCFTHCQKCCNNTITDNGINQHKTDNFKTALKVCIPFQFDHSAS